MSAPEISLVFDIETNGLKPTLVHCIAIKCLTTGEEFLCADHPGYLPISLGLDLLQGADWLIAHNGLDYDVPVLERLYPGFTIQRDRVIDTLPLARSFFKGLVPTDRLVESMPGELHGKHKLEAWGYRLGVHKGSFGKTADWSHFTPEMATYCMDDVRVTVALHELLMLAATEEAGAAERASAAKAGRSTPSLAA